MGALYSTPLRLKSPTRAFLSILQMMRARVFLPQGHIYKGENPGSLGYKAGLEGFSPMKSILGTFKENLGAEQLNNRAHRHLAGNADYEPLDLPFPKANIDKSHKRVIQTSLVL